MDIAECKCIKCKWFLRNEHEDLGVCMYAPFDISDMDKNDMGIMCGHDGPIYVGEDFGCVNFNKPNK